GVGFGAEYGSLKLEADVSYYFPRDAATRATLHVQDVTASNGAVATGTREVVITDAAEPVVDAAFGMEAHLSRAISLLGGVSSDFSAVPRLSNDAPPPIGSVATSRTHRAAGSFGIGSYGDGSELLLGTEISYAVGRTFVANDYVLPN